MKRWLLPVWFFIGIAGSCSEQIEIPQQVQFTQKTLWDDVKVLRELIANQEYERIKTEILADSLMVKSSSPEFIREIQRFTNKYGPLLKKQSWGQSWSRTDENSEKIRYVLNYKERTIYADFIFAGDSTDLKLHNYRFIEY
ncbi:MAG: hypothetical protein GF372_14350 [Candidatus Marinimicrobia bacterium]|nr:hypothetical protein [Candidatus Neomarinimicrobiota bacterium]